MNNAPGKHEDICIVTVVYGKEIPFLKVQASSIARHFSEADIGKIYIIVNDRDEDGCVAEVEGLLHTYGPFRDRVEIVRPSQMLNISMGAKRWQNLFPTLYVRSRIFKPLRRASGWRGNRGWMLQQAFKLSISRRITQRYTLVLDAKNFLVAPFRLTDIVAETGAPKSHMYRPSPSQRTWIRRAFEILSVPVPNPDAPAAPSRTPFCIETSVLKGCLEAVEEKVGPVDVYFGYRPFRKKHRRKASEFMLVYAYIVKTYGSWWQYFAPGLGAASGITKKMDSKTVDSMLDSLEQETVKVFFVHSNASSKLEQHQLDRLRKLLSRCQVELHWMNRGG